MYEIKLSKKNRSITLKKIQRNITLNQTGKRGPQGIQGIQGEPGDPASNIVTSVNTQIGDVVLDANDVGADPAGAAASVGATKVDKTTTVNGHTLSSDVIVIASEVPFAPDAGISSDNVQGAITELRDDTLEALNLKADVADVNTGLSMKEDLVNKDTSVALGNSDILYPTQNAVKSYVDTAIGNIPADFVTSVFGRTGIIISQGGDYTASQITNVPAGNISSTDVQGALNELDTEKQPLITAGTTLQYYRGDKTFQTLNTSVVPESGNLYFTDARAQAAIATGGLYVLKSGDTMTGTLGSQSLNPSADLTYNLGTTRYYNQIRAQRHYFNATSYIDGTSAGIATLSGSLTVGTNLTVSNSSFLAYTQINSSLSIPLSIVSNAASGFSSGAGIVALSNDGAALGASERMGFLLFGGNYDTTNSYNSSGVIGYTTEVWSATNRGSRLDFEVTTNATVARTVGLRIDHNKTVYLFGSLAPTVNNTLAIGDPSLYFNSSYEQRRYFNSTAYMDGAVAGTISIGAGNLGILATGGAATHSLTLGSTATGIVLYNTSDQVTNYERFRFFWSANQLNISNEVGGTGASRSIRINVYSGGLIVNASSSATQGFIQATQNSALGGQGTFSVNGALTASSGIQYAQIIAPTYTQTSTASGIDLLINRTETSVGSGNQRFIDMQVAGVSKASIANNGRVSGLDFVASTNFRSVSGGLGNDGTFNNASVIVPSTGTVIARNIADANPALIVNNTNASSTGNILTLQAAGVTKVGVAMDGSFTYAAAANMIFDSTTGTKIGTAITQKIGFYNVTPRVQGTAITDATGTIASVQSQLNLLLAFMRSWGPIAP